MSVSYEIGPNGVAEVVFDDGKANAYSLAVLEEMNAALDRARSDEARALVLAGRPGRFSAGFSLADMTVSEESMRTLVISGARFIGRLLLEPYPVVAACTGHALAAGALVLLGADRRIGATGDWKIGLNEVSIGMALPLWAVELGRHRLDPRTFDWRVVLGQVATPAEAVSDGFLDRLVEPDEVLPEARRVAEELSVLRRGAVEGTKQRARGALVHRMLDGIEEDMATVSTPEPA
jgi:enoyl-CoA hydratase